MNDLQSQAELAPVDVNGALTADMRFVGIVAVIFGGIASASIIGAVVGVPLLLFGLRIREAAVAYRDFATDGDSLELSAALEKLAGAFKMLKFAIFAQLAVWALTILLFIVFGLSILGAILEGAPGMRGFN